MPRPFTSPHRRQPFGRDARPSGRRAADPDGAYWMFGLHAVRAALENPQRVKRKLILTPNAARDLEAATAVSGMTPQISDPRRFEAPLDPGSVHQGAALWVEPLAWGDWTALCARRGAAAPPRVLLLDQVTDPHNVGAILRSALVFGARAVLAPQRRAAPETGALAKAASGALERAPYVQVKNLAAAMESLRSLDFALVGLDGAASTEIGEAAERWRDRPLAVALGAEGPGLRQKTRETCDVLARIEAADALGGENAHFASLNVSNAAAVALFATRTAG